MEYLNKVQLRGKVGNSLCKTYGSEGKMYNRFSVCTERIYNDREGNQVVEVMWHNCMVFSRNELPEVDTSTKGCSIELTGRLRNTKYTDQSGAERVITEVLVQEFKVLASDGQ